MNALLKSATGRRFAWADSLKRFMGLDRAIVYTVLARICGILGSTGTVLLIVRFMRPVEQGYYYVLLSLISLRAIFELGVMFVIIQMAAHECVHLVLHPDGSIHGDPVAKERLASLLQKTVRWFLFAGTAMAAVLLPLGWHFFAARPVSGTAIHWQLPWVLAVLATACIFMMDSIIFFLEGCGQIWQVARMRLAQALCGAAAAWGSLALRHGLFAPAMVSLSYCLAGALFLWRRRRLLATLLHSSIGNHAIAWRAEVWPFQWRIAVSSLCVYFTAQIFTPIVFAARGPVQAGQIGMSMSITGYMASVVLAWMSTKVPIFGALAANRDMKHLDRLYFHTLRQSLPLLAVMAVACEGSVIALRRLAPHIASRMVSPAVFALLLITVISSYVVQTQAMYLRAFKREPFLLQSLLVSGVTVAGCLLAARIWGNPGVAFSYFLGTGVVGLISGTAIFRSWRKGFTYSEDPTPVTL